MIPEGVVSNIPTDGYRYRVFRNRRLIGTRFAFCRKTAAKASGGGTEDKENCSRRVE